MDKSLISIILPVYNGEKYVEECIVSIMKQTYTQWELIVMNDGSNDGTDEICRKLAVQDERIKYHQIENAGVSHARNQALSQTRGEFVFFVDADDYLSNNCLEILINEQSKNNSDIVVMSNYNVYEDTGKIEKNEKIPQYAVLRNEKIVDTFLKTDQYGWEIWGKLYKKKLLTGITFHEERKIAEDALFLVEVLLRTLTVTMLTEYGYYYRINSQSVMAQKISLKNFDTILSVDDIAEMARKAGYESARGFKLKYYIWFLRHYVKGSNKESDRMFHDRIQAIKKEIRSSHIQDAKHMLTQKYFTEYILIKYVYGIYKVFIRLCYE